LAEGLITRPSNKFALAGSCATLMMMPHDDDKRQYASGPAQGLPDSKIGTFARAPGDEAKP
jgi:hypothetical protein